VEKLLIDERLPASVGVFCSLEVIRQDVKCLKQWTTNIILFFSRWGKN